MISLRLTDTPGCSSKKGAEYTLARAPVHLLHCIIALLARTVMNGTDKSAVLFPERAASVRASSAGTHVLTPRVVEKATHPQTCNPQKNEQQSQLFLFHAFCLSEDHSPCKCATFAGSKTSCGAKFNRTAHPRRRGCFLTFILVRHCRGLGARK